MADPFAGSRLKLNRGIENLEALYAELMEVLKADPVVVDGKTNLDPPDPPSLPDGTPLKTHTIYISNAPAFRPETGLLVGETLQAFRSSLDYLTWALVKRVGARKLNASQERKIQFPMAKTRKSYWDQLDGRLRGVPRTPYRTLIETYQPYRRSPVGRAMKALRDLSDIDKHRILIPALAFPFEGQAEVKVNPGWVLLGHEQLLPLHRPVKRGTKIARLLLIDIGPGKTSVEMDGEFVTYPELPGRRPLEATFNSIRDSCIACLNDVAAELGVPGHLP